MRIGTGLLALTAGIVPLPRDCGRADGSGRQHETRLFGATCMTKNNPYFDMLDEEIERVAETNGDIPLTGDPLQDQEEQSRQIQEMIDEDIQMLFLNPVDWEKMQPALDACKGAGVGIINVDMAVKDRDSMVSVIETDNRQAGQLCALDVMKRKGEARVVILDNLIQTSITNREQGFLDIIANNDNYQMAYREVVAGEIGVSSHVMADLLRRDISFDMILGGNDPTALGVLAALQQVKRGEGVLIYGIDSFPDFKAILDVGYVTGTSVRSPRSIDRKAAETAYRYLDGEPVKKYISLSSTIATGDNLHESEIDGWQ